MNPIDLKVYCPQHHGMTKQLGDLMVETQAQTMTLRDSNGKLDAIKVVVEKHQLVHDVEEKVKGRWKWIVPVLVAVALALLGAVFSAGKMLSTGPDAKEIAAAVVAAQKWVDK